MQDRIDSSTSSKIRNMSLLCAILVVSIHVGWPHEVALSPGWWINCAVKEGISRVAVPFFFVVSGYFLARHFDEPDWWRSECTKRLSSLLIPFAAWSVFAVIATMPLSIIADIIAHRPFGTSIYVLHGVNWLRLFGFDLTDYPFHVPLWYVRCLFFFVLSAYAFKWVVERLGVGALFLAFIFHLLHNHIPWENLREFFRMGYSAMGIFYFALGIYIQRKTPRGFTSRNAAICLLIGSAILAAKIVFVYNGWKCAVGLGKVSLPFLIYGVWHFMSDARLPNWLTACSFPIFLMHTTWLSNIGVFAKHMNCSEVSKGIMGWIGSVSLSIAATLVLRKSLPGFASVLFGGR